MAIKVLVFESDAAFAGELRSELGKLGCVVSVVDDGNVGLQQAGADRPDLILLSIELPRMNGFSVCNKLKKDPALKDVPLIIMSSESSDETFEQHRKLRTRAEDYVHKPIAFSDLQRHIEQFVRLGGSMAPDGQIVIEDEISLANVEMEDEGTQIAKRPPNFGPPPVPKKVDADIDAFTDAAFGMLEGNNEAPSLEPVNGAHAHAVSERPAPVPSVRPPTGEFQSVRPPTGEFRSVAPPPLPGPQRSPSLPSIPSLRPSNAPRSSVDAAEIERLKGDLERAKGDVDRARSDVDRARTDTASAKADVEKARKRAADVERELELARDDLKRAREAAGQAEEEGERAARAEAEVQRMQRDIDELKGRLSSAAKGGGVSSREFLDLREALNKKDKEILNLRDQVTKKERELLESADRSLGLERSKAELEDKSSDQERELLEAKSRIESLGADKEQAKKASEDFRARHARAQTELDARGKELAEVRSKAQETEARFEAELASLKADTQQALDQERAAREHAVAEADAQRQSEAEAAAAALDEAKVNAAREKSEALTQRERELRQETDGKLAALHRAHTDELNRVKTDHGQKLQGSEKAAAEKLAAREAELIGLHTSEKETLERERDERIAAMENDHRTTQEVASREHAEKVSAIESDRDERLSRLKQDTDEKIVTLENDRDSRVAALEARLARELAEARAVADAHKAASDEQIGTLERDLAQVREELSSLREAKEAGDQASSARIAELERSLADTERARDDAQKLLTDARERITQMEIDLAATRGELSDIRQQLDTETARAARAFAKWESDRSSLDRAKDALAVALQQIEEAEARSL
ncbi:MAG TPA: response regulator [Polyangiaceae bacterium]|jgi:CheY-like chemotaxis protein/chromosome segregation ATPase